MKKSITVLLSLAAFATVGVVGCCTGAGVEPVQVHRVRRRRDAERRPRATT